MTTDVNEAFFAEKRAQIDGARERFEDNQRRIADYDSGLTQAALDAKLEADVASGKIRMLGNDRYLVLTGYDRSETFSVQRARRPEELALVIPEDGLDKSKGYAALYTRVPAWHSLGNVVPEGITDVQDVMRLAGLDYTVLTAPATFNPGDAGGDLAETTWDDVVVPGSFVNFRSDTRAPLGVVGKDFTVIQNTEAFSFLQDLTGKGDLLWESAGATKGGSHVFTCVRLPEDVTVDAEGINDTIVPFVAVFNGHDGSLKLTAAVTPWRPVCGNTERMAMRDAHTKWSVRHTRSATARVDEAARTLRLSTEYFGRYAKEETQLAQSEMLLDEFVKLTREIFGEPDKDASQREKTLAETRTGLLVARYKTETSRAGNSLYAAERAVTGYVDHDKTRRSSALYGPVASVRAASAIEGFDDDVKSTTHRRLMAMRTA